MIRKILFPLFLAIALMPNSESRAQQGGAAILIKNQNYNFGVIKEEAGIVICDFEIENAGKSPLIIQRVVSTCNCTSADWVKNPIAPGSKSVVKVKYDPKGRPGQFNQTVTVFSNADKPTLVLQIQGKVQERPKSLEEIYNRPIGDLRFTSNNIYLNKITPSAIKIDTVEFINLSNKTIKIGGNVGSLTYITVKFVPEVVKQNEKGIMIISYDAKKRNDWGFVSDRIAITQNGEQVANGSIGVSASIEEDYSKLSSEELAKAPSVEFKNKICDFGSIDEGKVVEFEFSYKNVGKSNLIIHKIKPGCGCTTVNSGINVIKPGDSTSFKASFRTNGYQGRVNKSITVYLNDPKSPVVTLSIVGVVNATKN